VAAPLVERVIGEPATPCAGYARFVAAGQRIEFGLRWRPDKWAPFVDGYDRAIRELDVMADLHVWIETRAHVIDFSTFQIEAMMQDAGGAWPPLICWPKWRLPKHPREARGDRALLLWRNPAALLIPMIVAEPVVGPATRRALEIFEGHVGFPVPSATIFPTSAAVTRTAKSDKRR
jgi:hypothetical protein